MMIKDIYEFITKYFNVFGWPRDSNTEKIFFGILVLYVWEFVMFYSPILKKFSIIIISIKFNQYNFILSIDISDMIILYQDIWHSIILQV